MVARRWGRWEEDEEVGEWSGGREGVRHEGGRGAKEGDEQGRPEGNGAMGSEGEKTRSKRRKEGGRRREHNARGEGGKGGWCSTRRGVERKYSPSRIVPHPRSYPPTHTQSPPPTPPTPNLSAAALTPLDIREHAF